MAVITPLFAAVFGIIYMALSINVIRYRLTHKVSLGAGGNQDLHQAIRTHSNFVEYVPFALLLMWFIETLTLSATAAFWLGSILLVARVSHVFGLFYPKQFMGLRYLGSVATIGVIFTASVVIFQHYLPLSV